MVWLSCKGYRLLDHRARTAAGEIDLVARRGDYLVFVEVKARRTLTAALESFGERQRRRIIRAASLWRARHRGFEHLHMRYDLFLVASGRLPQHRRAAWIPQPREALDLL